MTVVKTQYYGIGEINISIAVVINYYLSVFGFKVDKSYNMYLIPSQSFGNTYVDLKLHRFQK